VIAVGNETAVGTVPTVGTAVVKMVVPADAGSDGK
jgi:hypothetical protein